MSFSDNLKDVCLEPDCHHNWYPKRNEREKVCPNCGSKNIQSYKQWSSRWIGLLIVIFFTLGGTFFYGPRFYFMVYLKGLFYFGGIFYISSLFLGKNQFLHRQKRKGVQRKPIPKPHKSVKISLKGLRESKRIQRFETPKKATFSLKALFGVALFFSFVSFLYLYDPINASIIAGFGCVFFLLLMFF